MQNTTVSKFRIAMYGIIIEDGKVLMTETKVPSGSVMNFPGGGLELGEPPAEALEREFREETAITVRIGEVLYCSRRFQQNPDFPTEQLIHIYYRVFRVGGEVSGAGNGDDVLKVVWAAPEDLSIFRIVPADQEFIDDMSFQSLLRKPSPD
jgi:8-oxo-dGTP diphosphatase